MKQLLIAMGCALILFGAAGCQNSRKTGGDSVRFPDSVVGVWEVRSEDYQWGFKFECDGSISKMVHFLVGQLRLSEGGKYMEGLDPNTYAVFMMGPCEADYDPEMRRLKVKVILDHYEMRLPDGVLSGRSEDYFDGIISETGKAWDAEWRSYGWLEGADPPDADYIETHPEPVQFIKLDLKNPPGSAGSQ